VKGTGATEGACTRRRPVGAAARRSRGSGRRVKGHALGGACGERRRRAGRCPDLQAEARRPRACACGATTPCYGGAAPRARGPRPRLPPPPLPAAAAAAARSRRCRQNPATGRPQWGPPTRRVHLVGVLLLVATRLSAFLTGGVALGVLGVAAPFFGVGAPFFGVGVAAAFLGVCAVAGWAREGPGGGQEAARRHRSVGGSTEGSNAPAPWPAPPQMPRGRPHSSFTHAIRHVPRAPHLLSCCLGLGGGLLGADGSRHVGSSHLGGPGLRGSDGEATGAPHRGTLRASALAEGRLQAGPDQAVRGMWPARLLLSRSWPHPSLLRALGATGAAAAAAAIDLPPHVENGGTPSCRRPWERPQGQPPAPWRCTGPFWMGCAAAAWHVAGGVGCGWVGVRGWEGRHGACTAVGPCVQGPVVAGPMVCGDQARVGACVRRSVGCSASRAAPMGGARLAARTRASHCAASTSITV
jgi:hypothetical protein